ETVNRRPFPTRRSSDLGSACVQNLCIAPRIDGGAPTPSTCVNDSDCLTGSRCGFDGLCYAKWGCLEQSLDWPTTTTAPFEFRMRSEEHTSELQSRENLV